MQKIADYIFDLSPKKLAVYLIPGPLVLFLAYTFVTISFKTISQNPPTSQITVTLLLGVIAIFFGLFILLWLLWLRSAVYAVQQTEIRLSRKWFQIAFIVLWILILFNLVTSLLETYLKNSSWDEYLSLIYASREFINFSGIMIAYPIVCHYAARAVMVKRSGESATFISAIPFTLLLIFGTVLGIPFLHKYFSRNSSTNQEVLVMYAIGFGLFLLILVIGFIAAITGMV
ncbi:hypothetical protein D1816_18540 [Aquimarina sp. AD10]|uniref:hypothetical protein n=1 Tax=Aquimarina sp. AD10 TaxID=1714849 RepID=UPI000E53658B|nr:hypothetical protein [Aquimarina sp. AD10]AXT62276.1 hypothetical protein D1816_18540 [Aquimarina sp. AD10]RKM90529.1 hypothetical protein D7033_23840 [Aquimarina sp. AD10]